MSQRLADLRFRLPLLIIGVVGFVAFIATGFSGVLPWIVSGPIAAAFLSLIIIAQIVEYFETPKTKPPPPNVHKSQVRRDSVSVSSKNSPLRGAVTLQPKESKKYGVSLTSGESLTIEVGAGNWISVELVGVTEALKKEANKRYYVERAKEGKNLTIEYDAKRNGNWFVYVTNKSRTSLEVGTTLKVIRMPPS